jgi:hypothetical protein
VRSWQLQIRFLGETRAALSNESLAGGCSILLWHIISTGDRLHPNTGSMAILFKTTISENSAFEVIKQALTSGQPYDGYFNAVSDAGETTFPWSPSVSADAFFIQVEEMLRMTWDVARFWVIYERREDRKDSEITEMRNAALRLTRGYNNVIVASLSLLGKRDAAHDLELVFVCFTEDFQRRNFRVRYEGKTIET